MGIVLSRFRKKKTTIEILEDLESKINEIEQYGQDTEQKHKKVVGTLVIYSVTLYIITAFTFYFYFFPASLYDQIFYITPLLIVPILIILTKKMVSWYFKRKISRNQEKLKSMREEKKKILENVTETETYKKAKKILMKFAPDELRIAPPTPKAMQTIVTAPTPTPPQRTAMTPTTGDLRRRVLTGSNQPSTRITAMEGNISLHGATSFETSQSTLSPSTGMCLPRPILPRNRTYLDRLVDYLIGDGPSNRYALICRQCGSHNGMAVKEEFEYFAFRCCFCNFWNPARKQRPNALKLETDSNTPSKTPESKPAEYSSTLTDEPPPKFSDSPSPSDTDSDIEVVERPTEMSESVQDIAEQCFNADEQELAAKEITALKSDMIQGKSEKSREEPMEVDDDLAN